MRRIAIVGCRPPPSPSSAEHWSQFGRIIMDVASFVRSFTGHVVIVSGGADGVDVEAARVAAAYGYEVIVHRPDYATYGQRAPLERNTLIVADADEVHALPGPWSRGTWSTCNIAKRIGKPLFVHRLS